MKTFSVIAVITNGFARNLYVTKAVKEDKTAIETIKQGKKLKNTKFLQKYKNK